MKRLILHIGTGKTGTSSIQNYFFFNRSILERNFDLFYPEYGISHAQHFGFDIHAHYPIVSWITERNTTNLKKLHGIILTSKCGTTVLSCENLYHHLSQDDIDYVASIMTELEIQVVCYIRRQDLYIESAWKQQVKVGALKTPFEIFLKRHTDIKYLHEVHANYYQRLGPWVKTFGIEALIIKVFNKNEWTNGDLLDDFIELCGLDLKQVNLKLTKNLQINTSLPSDLIQLIRKINYLELLSKKEQSLFINDIKELGAFRDASLLSYNDRLAVLENYKQSNILLFKHYVNREIPFCFTPQSVDKPIKMGNQALLEDIAIQTLVCLWKKSFSLKGIRRKLLKFVRKLSDLLPFKPIFKLKKIKKLIKKFGVNTMPWPPEINDELKFKPELNPADVVAIIKDCQINLRPLSVIRLGDGESAVIGFPEFTPEMDFIHNLNVFFGKNTLSHDQQYNFVSEVRNAVRHADVVGVVGGESISRFTIVRHFMSFYELSSPNTKMTHLSLHRSLQEQNLYKSFLFGLDEIGVITCRDVAEIIKETFNIGNVVVYSVPEESKFAKSKDKVKRHYPDRFEEIKATLKVSKPGMLFLVGAGPLGKVYCRWIKERGGIALDIGSMFDAWAGLKTRKFMENEKGDLNQKYLLR